MIPRYDTAFRQQIFDVAKAQGKPDVKPDRLLDDLGRKAIAGVAAAIPGTWPAKSP
jgi:hypothetical protein